MVNSISAMAATYEYIYHFARMHTQDSRRLLAERDGELLSLRSELERYKQQAAREIANKTRLAQALDESHSHARELEELLQQWQMEVGCLSACVSVCLCVCLFLLDESHSHARELACVSVCLSVSAGGAAAAVADGGGVSVCLSVSTHTQEELLCTNRSV